MRRFMKKSAAFLVLISHSLLVSGCASIVSGRHQDVQVISNPPGAEVMIDGMKRGSTPMVVELKRSERHTIKLSKEGYLEETRGTKKGFNWWFTGNIIVGGIIGIIIDFATGAVYKVKPEDINVEMKQV